MLVANKVDDESELQRIEERLGLPIAVAVPLDAAVYGNDRQGRSPLDGNDSQAFVQAVDGLLDHIIATYDSSTMLLREGEVRT